MESHDGRTMILTGSLLVIIIIMGTFLACVCSCSTNLEKDLIEAIQLEQKFEKDSQNAS